MRIAILSPIYNSLYARLVTHLAVQEPGVEVSLIIVRTIININRIRGELRRDGPRLLNKIHQKLFLGEKYEDAPDSQSLSELAKAYDLPGKSLKHLGKLNQIPLITVNDHNHPNSATALLDADLDAILFTGGGLIRKQVLNASRLGVVNCHAGLLPQYRGMDVVEWAALEAQSFPPKTGLTLHIMDKGVDTGPILKTQPIPLLPRESIKSLRRRIEPEMVKLMISGLCGLRDGTLEPIPQAKQDGKQYFVLHPRLKSKINHSLSKLVPPRE